jgi:hypothetical protein
VIQVDAHPRIGDGVDQRGEVAVDGVIRQFLEEERRQNEAARNTCTQRVARQRDCVGQRGATGANDHPRGGYAGREQCIERRHALGDGERLAFAGRAERGDAFDTLCEQPTNVRGEPRVIDTAVGGERCERRAPQAANRCIGHRQTPSARLRACVK